MTTTLTRFTIRLLCAAAIAALLLLTACSQAAPKPDYAWLTFGEQGNTFVYANAATVMLAVTGKGNYSTADTSAAAGCFALHADKHAARVQSSLCKR